MAGMTATRGIQAPQPPAQAIQSLMGQAGSYGSVPGAPPLAGNPGPYPMNTTAQSGPLRNLGSIGGSPGVPLSPQNQQNLAVDAVTRARDAESGTVAYQRSLEAAKLANEQAVSAASAQAGYGKAATQQGFDLGERGKQTSYQLGQQGADANQNRLFGALDRLGINSLMSQSSGGGGGGVPRESGGDANWGAANAAAFGRAKDQSAQAVGAAQRAMQNNMADRGISGSGIEAKQDMGIQLAGAGQLGAAGRDIATNTAQRAGAVADRNYAGGIQQRGQDMAAQEAAAARNQQMLQSLMSLFKVSASY